MMLELRRLYLSLLIEELRNLPFITVTEVWVTGYSICDMVLVVARDNGSPESPCLLKCRFDSFSKWHARGEDVKMETWEELGVTQASARVAFDKYIKQGEWENILKGHNEPLTCHQRG